MDAFFVICENSVCLQEKKSSIPEFLILNSSINQCEQQIDSINHIFGCFHRQQHSNDDHNGGQQQNDGSHRKRFGTYPQQHYQQYRLKTKSLSIRQEKSIENNNLDDDDDDYDGESNTMNTSNMCRLVDVHFDRCLFASCNSFIQSFEFPPIFIIFLW